MNHEDIVLSTLCQNLINRKLPKMVFSNEPFDAAIVAQKKQLLCEQMGIDIELTDYFIYTDSVRNSAYSLDKFNIKILFKNGTTTEISKASDQYNIEALSKSVTKYFMCYPKSIITNN
jgi:SAM-dependent MidA family methyltransferase